MALSFEEALKTFSPAEASVIETTLRNWVDSDGLARDIVRNLKELERFLPPLNMAQLLQAIYSCHGKTADELRMEYLRACHRNVMQGGIIQAPQPLFLGRAVEKEPFIQTLWKMHGKIPGGTGRFLDVLEVREFVLHLLSGKLESDKRALVMSEYAVWVTWNTSDLSADPFSFASSATEVRACIGLDSLISKKGEPLLLLVYKKPTVMELLRPTIADAGLYKYYEPPPGGLDAHGMTKPWSEAFTPGFRPRPLPEAIHAAAVFDLLITPVKEIA